MLDDQEEIKADGKPPAPKKTSAKVLSVRENSVNQIQSKDAIMRNSLNILPKASQARSGSDSRAMTQIIANTKP